MDNKRFDSLTRAFASGQSRRSVLKGLLGFGGAAAVSTVVADDTDARRNRRSSASTASTCSGVGEEMCGTHCCVAPETCNWFDNGCCAEGTHKCDTNSTGCCSDCATGGVTCGYDCCDSVDACCDNECCPSGEVCVANILDCSSDLCEERCCVEEQICDGRCCHGTCFWDIHGSGGDDDDDDGTDRDCCPPFANYCGYSNNDHDFGVCCHGDTPICCRDWDGYPTCLREDQCCGFRDCVDKHGGEDACWICKDNSCKAVPSGDQGDCDECFGCSGTQECVPNPTVNGDSCGGDDDDDDDDGSGVCCGGTCCDSDLRCCDRILPDGSRQQLCINPRTQCCQDDGCPLVDDDDDDDDECTTYLCGADNQCVADGCVGDETCCVSPEPICIVIGDGVCCTTEDCDNECLECAATQCTAREGTCGPDDAGTCAQGECVFDLPIFKEDEHGERLPGACFSLYAGPCGPAGNTLEVQCVGSADDPDQGNVGRATFAGYPEGTYCVVESTVPTGYTGSGPVTVSLPDNQSGRTFSNTCAGECCADDDCRFGDDDDDDDDVCCGGSCCDTQYDLSYCVDDVCLSNFTVFKSYEGGTPSDEACFTLYEDTCDNQGNAAATECALNGDIHFSNLPPGDYCLVETTVPTGFQGVDPQNIALPQDRFGWSKTNVATTTTTQQPTTTTPASCEPNCDCSDQANDGLDCNGGLAAGGGICACGFCVVPLDGCPCGCAGDDECVRCAGEGVCETYNQGGSCNSGAGICEDEFCVTCRPESDLPQGVVAISVAIPCQGDPCCDNLLCAEVTLSDQSVVELCLDIEIDHCLITGCPEGQICNLLTGDCEQTTSTTAGPECTADDQCGDVRCNRCINNTCVTADDHAVRGCPSGYACCNGTCCDQICDAGTCVECYSKSDCGTNEECVDSTCQCADGYKLCDGVCIPDDACCDTADCVILDAFVGVCLALDPITNEEINLCVCADAGTCVLDIDVCIEIGDLCLLSEDCCDGSECVGVSVGPIPIAGRCTATITNTTQAPPCNDPICNGDICCSGGDCDQNGDCCTAALCNGDCCTGGQTCVGGQCALACSGEGDCLGLTVGACAGLDPLEICACLAGGVCGPLTVECTDASQCLAGEVQACVTDELCICLGTHICGVL